MSESFFRELEGISIKINNFKCFGEDYEGFDIIKPINLLIGRNNSGKSSLIDLIELLNKQDSLNNYSHKGNIPEYQFSKILTPFDVERVFHKQTSGGIIGENHWNYGNIHFSNKRFDWYFNTKGGERKFKVYSDYDSRVDSYVSKFVDYMEVPLKNKKFYRLNSDRDIKSEPFNEINVTSQGEGATSLIAQYINRKELPTSLIEQTLLSELNKIFEPDAKFIDITVQISNNNWEIYLHEENKGRIALSQSGSGLKTIILVLIFLHIIPYHSRVDLNKCIFAFEELENNLHPALQRKLFDYLRVFAQKNGPIFFITTHSNVVIDMFSNDEYSQIIHVTHNGEIAKAHPTLTYIENKSILSDLDVRASDLLQSNCIIWVEGPSDRLYINRWIELWTNGELKESVHYQCVFYGGRLLYHLSVETPETNSDLVKILAVNSNSILVIDSDKKKISDDINLTKQRMVSEFENINGLCWVTEGKEIENYIPADALNSLYSKEDLSQIYKYNLFDRYLNDKIEKGLGNKFLNNKVLFAEQIIPHITKENSSAVLDLDDRLNEIVDRIYKWNGLNKAVTQYVIV